MYLEYFGLTQPPFKITPDTRLFFPGGNRGAVLEALKYAVSTGEGITKVVGEVGSGKTMLCRMLEQELPESVEVVYLANPSLSPDDILYAIAFDLKIPVSREDDRLHVMQRLQELLVERHAGNQRVVVFVEEAQAMPEATLEEIRLLSNLETRTDKLLQIVLFGQPELNHTLAAHDMRQLRDRITYSFELEPLDSAALRDYLGSRTSACGFRGGELFHAGAVRSLGRYSGGLLRRVNVLAEKALLAAFADNAKQVKAQHVRRAAKDAGDVDTTVTRSNWPRLAVFGLAGAVVLALILSLALSDTALQGSLAPPPQDVLPAVGVPVADAVPVDIEDTASAARLAVLSAWEGLPERPSEVGATPEVIRSGDAYSQ